MACTRRVACLALFLGALALQNTKPGDEINASAIAESLISMHQNEVAPRAHEARLDEFELPRRGRRRFQRRAEFEDRFEEQPERYEEVYDAEPAYRRYRRRRAATTLVDEDRELDAEDRVADLARALRHERLVASAAKNAARRAAARRAEETRRLKAEAQREAKLEKLVLADRKREAALEAKLSEERKREQRLADAIEKQQQEIANLERNVEVAEANADAVVEGTDAVEEATQAEESMVVDDDDDKVSAEANAPVEQVLDDENVEKSVPQAMESRLEDDSQVSVDGPVILQAQTAEHASTAQQASKAEASGIVVGQPGDRPWYAQNASGAGAQRLLYVILGVALAAFVMGTAGSCCYMAYQKRKFLRAKQASK